MEVVKGVLCQSAQRVQGEGLTIVSVMAEGRDANLKGVERVHKAALIFARHMEEGRDALGATLGQNLARLMFPVTHLLGEGLVSVHPTVPWCKTSGFMVLPPWEQWSMTQNLGSLRS